MPVTAIYQQAIAIVVMLALLLMPMEMAWSATVATPQGLDHHMSADLDMDVHSADIAATHLGHNSDDCCGITCLWVHNETYEPKSELKSHFTMVYQLGWKPVTLASILRPPRNTLI